MIMILTNNYNLFVTVKLFKINIILVYIVIVYQLL